MITLVFPGTLLRVALAVKQAHHIPLRFTGVLTWPLNHIWLQSVGSLGLWHQTWNSYQVIWTLMNMSQMLCSWIYRYLSAHPIQSRQLAAEPASPTSIQHWCTACVGIGNGTWICCWFSVWFFLFLSLSSYPDLILLKRAVVPAGSRVSRCGSLADAPSFAFMSVWEVMGSQTLLVLLSQGSAWGLVLAFPFLSLSLFLHI